MRTKRRHTETEYYPVVMDWWVAALVVIILAALVLTIPVIIMSVHSLLSIVVLVSFVIVNFLFLVDKAFYTAYFLEEEALVITGQLRKIVIPYRYMQKLRPGNFFGLFSLAGRKRFALSAKCLYITLRGGHWKQISLSPEHRDDFVNSLLEKIEDSRPTTVKFSQKKAK